MEGLTEDQELWTGPGGLRFGYASILKSMSLPVLLCTAEFNVERKSRENCMQSLSEQRYWRIACSKHVDLVRSVVVLGERFVVSGSYDKTIKIWYCRSGTLVADFGRRAYWENPIHCI